MSVTPRRVVVVGGGIAGVGAAWALGRAGVEVHLIEREPALGGNAKTHVWPTPAGPVETGLSVLAWPAAYFHHYQRLMSELGVACEPTPPLRFLVEDGGAVWAHGVASDAWNRHAAALDGWERLVAWVRRVNARFHPSEAPSMYAVSPANPLNLVPLRWLSRRFGVTDAFWEEVFVSVHSSSFLTVDLDGLPSVIAPVLEDIVSLARGGSLQTWSASSADVFRRMTDGLAAVHLGSPVSAVVRRPDGVTVRHAGGDVDADAVVIATAAPVALSMLDAPGFAERHLLGGVHYPDGDPLSELFLTGVVHSDASVIPRPGVNAQFCNAVTLHREDGRLRYENTFIISSWAPTARGGSTPMLVSYGRRGPIEGEQRRISNRLAHPSLTTGNLLRAFALRFLQGRRRTWYCGSWVTPGNGHDLSLLSGLVIAEALGAPHPFADDPACVGDLRRLRRMMLGRG